MAKALWCVLATALLLAGCASFEGQRQEQARKLEEIFAQCRAKSRDSGGYAGEALCAQQPVRRVYAEGDYPYMDLVDLYLAHWVAIARQVDQGRLKVDEGQLQLKEQLFRVITEADRRDARHNNYRLMLMDLRPTLLD